MFSTRRCIKGYFLFTLIVFVIVMTLFFMEAVSAETIIGGDKTSFGELWQYILLALALNLGVALFFFIRFQRGVYSKLESMEQGLEKDSITNLYSFKNFLKYFPEKLVEYQHKKKTGALVIVSMDDFKKINSIGGYEVGNEVLLTFAEKLKSMVAPEELIARYFGDEIILFLQGESPEQLKQRIILLWQKCPQYIEVGNVEYIIRVSMGAKIIKDTAGDPDKMINRATMAKVKAKQKGGNCCEFYSDETDFDVKNELAIEKALFHALENKEFYLVYQPIVDIKTHEISCNEALLRWDNDQFKQMPILDVIRIAEKRGIIREIGEWVLREACRQNKLWQDRGLGNMAVSVNVSAMQMDQPNFVNIVQNALDRSGLDPEYLQLEITETIAMHDVKSKLLFIQELKKMGVKISIDDFGTGYSSLSYFANLPVDNLKIDKSFIQDMSMNENSKMVINTIINLARGMNISTTAEGVEEYSHAARLQHMGCNNIQGYLVTKPLRPELLEELIMKLPMREEESQEF